ncbi:hypothetical protein IIA15_08180 [candidate division TA06 bacterium]|nr:hypothetical protein [candidate division TA06 bacterium]
MIGLDEEEIPYLRKLPVGHGFIMCRMAKHDPFLIEFPKFPMTKGIVTDEDIHEHMMGKAISEIQGSKESLKESPEPEPVPAFTEEVSEQALKILEAVGMGAGSFASQIYSKAKMSGKTFDRQVKRLIDQGLVGMKRAKTGRNVMHFYFLTDQGDQVFDKEFKRPSKVYDKDVSEVIGLLEDAGWLFDREGKKLIFSEGNNHMTVCIENSLDRKKMLADLKSTPYFICVSESVRNLLLQEAAKRSYTEGPLTVFITTPEKFAKKADFEKIEFK